jgi:hypothetical protein
LGSFRNTLRLAIKLERLSFHLSRRSTANYLFKFLLENNYFVYFL